METYKPPVFDRDSDNSGESADFKPFDTGDASGQAEMFEADVLSEDKKARPAKKEFVTFTSKQFNEEGTLLTNVEEYTKKIQIEAESHVRLVRNEVDLIKSEIELELANAIIKRRAAEEEAQKIVQEAENSREEVIKAGTEKGFKAGFEDGLKQFKQQNEQNTQEILNLLNDMKKLRQTLLQKHEQNFVNLSTLIAKKIVHKHLATNKAAILNMLKKNISRLDGMGLVTISLNPDEYNFIAQYQSELSTFLGEDQVIKLKINPEVQSAAPLIETDFTVIDLDIKKQFKEVDKLFDTLVEDRKGLFKLS
ncbi:MAG: FliH/SctL family protein [Deltaproteobacteria bacterium]|nr:FliH/SctL family protein [Deltaproteobacteria bacterium]